MENQTLQPIFISAKDAAHMIGLSVDSIRRLEMRGEFPQRRQLSPGRHGYFYNDVVTWAKQR